LTFTENEVTFEKLLKSRKMSEALIIEKPVSQNGTSKRTLSNFELLKIVFKEIFSHVIIQGEAYLDRLTVTKDEKNPELMEDISLRMRALLATGLFSKAKLIDAQSKTKDQELQKLMVRAWLTSDTPPPKDECIDLMNSFAKEKGYLTATIMLCREKDFPFFNIAKFLIDNIDQPISMDLVRVLEENKEELRNRLDK
jgi:hypothetical protein